MSVSPEQALEWLCQHALPLWLEHGVDWRAGGFREDLDPASLTSRAEFRRLRVVTRQIYVFAQGARLGVKRAADAVALGVDFLRCHALQPDGGYAMRFDLAGQVIDQNRDLYDHAFVLLALTHAGERAAALAVMDYLDARFVHPAGGWRESLPDAAPRRQNPHMHLLEAVLSAGEHFGDAVFLDRADAIVGLFLDRLFQADASALPEYYDDALVPLRDQGRFVWEPGHHHEWVWLLDEYRRIAMAAGRVPRDTAAAARALMAMAETHGVRPDGIVLGEMWSDGQVKQAATRVWPHTERIKALCRSGGATEVPAALGALFGFFDGVPAGLWREKWDGGVVADGPAPASTLYHVTCALLEAQGRG